MTQAFPLQWPNGRPRVTKPKRASFKRSFTQARSELADELERLGARHVVLSTNKELRLDGWPRADQAEPADPGVAVYFEWRGRAMTFACDRWDRVKDNINAIANTIAALRGIERWGSGEMLEQAFAGFTALPAPDHVKMWWDVLGVDRAASLADITGAYKRLVKERHPDRPGGSTAAFQELQAAYKQAMEAAHG
jgi:DnaJ-domain-containing protein 1